MNNPKAFPTYYYQQEQDGMDLRDYFAAKAMQGINWMVKNNNNWDETHAKRSYEIADAMIKAREQ